MKRLRVGEIPYANVWPLYALLREQGSCSSFSFTAGVPTELNRLLLEGHLDVSPSSSVEYLFHQEAYEYLPNLSISSRGPVRSILLLSRKHLHELDGGSVALTDQSATSVFLARVILEEFRGVTPRYTQASGMPRGVLASHDAFLVIGDDALLAGLRPGPWHVYDLGELWWRETALPFVYALWIARREATADPDRAALLAELAEALQQAKQDARDRFAELAPRAPQASWYPEQRLVDYWKMMSYDLTEEHLKGMEHFFTHARGLRPVEIKPAVVR